MSESRGEGQTTSPPPTDALDQDDEAGTGAGDEPADACGIPQPSTPEQPADDEPLAVGAGYSTPEGDGSDGDGASQSSATPAPSLNNGGQASRPLSAMASPRSAEEDARTVAPSRGSARAPRKARGNGTGGTGRPCPPAVPLRAVFDGERAASRGVRGGNWALEMGFPVPFDPQNGDSVDRLRWASHKSICSDAPW